MKTSRGLTIFGSTLLLAAAAQGRAQSIDKLYLDFNIGPAIAQDTDIRVSPLGNNGSVQFDPGVRGDINLGYNFTPSFAGGLETGVIWNGINSIRGNTLSPAGASADVYQIPILANFIYKPVQGNFTPYIGVGVGGAATLFDSSNVPLFGPKYSDTDFTFAYQAEAGFKYSTGGNIEWGFAYQFLGTTGHSWSDNGIVFKTEGTMVHAVLATVTWKF